jgi:Leucine-rich repeat (LRR) protein
MHTIGFDQKLKLGRLPFVSLKELNLSDNRISQINNLDLLAELESLDLSLN